MGLACVAAPVYTSEVAAPAVRGTLGASFQLAINVGIVLGSMGGLLLVSICKHVKFSIYMWT